VDVVNGVSITATSTTHAGYLRVDCAGEFSPESATEVFERAYALATESGREAVLVDIRNTTGREPTMAERYALAVHVADAQASRKPRIRFALLGHEPKIHPERFGEIVAANRGAHARVFTDEAQALDWLLGRTAGP
jgi:hypothetical protein